MSTWRRRALELFPNLKNELNQKDYSPYWLFADLRHLAWQAHTDDDATTLRKVYGFAAWCNDQLGGELANAARVSFYEHLFDENKDRAFWERIVPWISPRIARDVWGLWEWRLSADELADLSKLFAKHDRGWQKSARAPKMER
ncbi:MAG TPA: hypothetical protein VH482_09555 [Thermomicrobiales bacterium]|jgi:hypothetical protein